MQSHEDVSMVLLQFRPASLYPFVNQMKSLAVSLIITTATGRTSTSQKKFFTLIWTLPHLELLT